MTEREQEITRSLSEVRLRIERAAELAHRDPRSITLIVVTKYFPISDVAILYDLGERNFGENRSQEGIEKSQALAEDCMWHFQGQIQSNKLRSITSWADVIHSLDQISHAEKMLDLQIKREYPVFIQVSLDQIDARTGRGGLTPELLPNFLRQVSQLPGLALQGLMAVAPLAEDPALAFARLAELQRVIINEYPQMRSLSCGMSGDFEAAIAAGATHIRIGSSILGSR